MELKFPQQGYWKQPNIGDQFGDIWASFNLDLISNPGKIRVAPRTKKISGSDDTGLSTLVNPAAFIRTSARGSDEWWALCNQRLLYSNANANPIAVAWIVDGTASSPTTALDSLYSDFAEFDQNLVVSLKTDLARLVSGTWTATWWTGAGTLNKRGLVTAIPHPLCVGFNNLLLIADQVVTNNEGGFNERAGQASVHTVDANLNVTLNRLIFPQEFEVMWIRSSRSAYYIGCRNKKSREAKVFIWDGYSPNFNEDYKVGSSDVFAGVIKDEICHILNGFGQLKKFNGGGFSEIARLPLREDKYAKFEPTAGSYPVHRNGMTVVDDRICFLLNADVQGSRRMLHNMMSGIWEYHEDIGLYHKYFVPNDQSNDFGSGVIEYAGALVQTDKTQGWLLGGAKVTKDNGSNAISLIFYVDIWDSSAANITDNTLKIGQMISPKFQGQGIEETWQHLFSQFAKFLNSTDKLVVKYRVDERNWGTNPLLLKSCTWVSTTQFTSASSQGWSDVVAGDEIMIITGIGAGFVTKVSSISLNGATYTVNIADAVSGASGTFLATAWEWVELESIADQVRRYKKTLIGPTPNSNWFQYKLIIHAKGNSPEIEKINLKSETKIKIE
ncbi:MAG: hypothetical protein [Siphoviridae sp. cttb18]|nr:MAG: hypothetical protein [Siphoviridae sp. cttb18]